MPHHCVEQSTRAPRQFRRVILHRHRRLIACLLLCFVLSATVIIISPMPSPHFQRPDEKVSPRIPVFSRFSLQMPWWGWARWHSSLLPLSHRPSSSNIAQHTSLVPPHLAHGLQRQQDGLSAADAIQADEPSITRSSIAIVDQPSHPISNIADRVSTQSSDHQQQHAMQRLEFERSLPRNPRAMGITAQDPVHRMQVTNGSFGVRPHAPSKLFQHFDADADGLLNEKEVANLLKQLTQRGGGSDGHPFPSSPRGGVGGTPLGLNSQGAVGLPQGIPNSPQNIASDLRDARESRAPGRHDVVIDGEILSVGDGDFELLFKQLSNLKHTRDPSKDPRMTLQEDIVFIRDLVIVFFAATLGGAIATYGGQPALIGFLLGGMTVGPGGLGIVTELVEVETLASLGIAFLLFSLGIEFSIHEFRGVRRVVTVGGLSSMAAIVLCTGALSLLLGLVKTIPEATALGLAVSLSSTAVVLQCLPQVEETGDFREGESSSSGTRTLGSTSGHAKPLTGNSGSPRYSVHSDQTNAHISRMGNGPHSATGFDSSPEPPVQHLSQIPSSTSRLDVAPSHPGRIGKSMSSNYRESTGFSSSHSRKVMLGLLVFQDVTIGLILALLPTLQGTLTQFIEEFLSAVLKLGCFITLCLIFGEFLLPTLCEYLERARSQEVFTIGMVFFCLAMSYVSEQMGLAIELGAFAAGIMLSESRLKPRVEASMEGIRGMFSAVFFVCVGMMIHWRYFYQNFLKMLALLGVVLISKTVIFALVICTLGKLSLKTSIACGAAIAQAGEFTFVVASKGQALLLFSASEARMISGATALSMLASPYIIRFARLWDLQRHRGVAPSTGRPSFAIASH